MLISHCSTCIQRGEMMGRVHGAWSCSGQRRRTRAEGSGWKVEYALEGLPPSYQESGVQGTEGQRRVLGNASIGNRYLQGAGYGGGI